MAPWWSSRPTGAATSANSSVGPACAMPCTHISGEIPGYRTPAQWAMQTMGAAVLTTAAIGAVSCVLAG